MSLVVNSTTRDSIRISARLFVCFERSVPTTIEHSIRKKLHEAAFVRDNLTLLRIKDTHKVNKVHIRYR